MIIRVPHRRKFTIIADAALRDTRLSFRATGVLAYLLSFPDGYEVSARRLTAVKAEGRDAILTALDELQTAGYLHRDRAQLEDGRWTTTVTVQELPTPENPDSVPGNRTVTSQQPSPEKPNSENQDLKTLSTKDEYLEAPPGNPTPKWADHPMWQDEKGRWFIGPRPDEAAS